MSRQISLCFSLHQPRRIRPYSIFDTTYDHDYYLPAADPHSDRALFIKMAERSYRPMLQSLLRTMQQHPDFSCSLAVSGTWLEQAQWYCPDTIDSIRHMVTTGQLELVATPYYHSLSYRHSETNFIDEITQHQHILKELFGAIPDTLVLPDFAYSTQVVEWAALTQFTNFLFTADDIVSQTYEGMDDTAAAVVRVFGAHRQLSDDIARRFSDRGWSEWPLTADKFSRWILDMPHETVPIALPLEVFGDRHNSESGIFNFFDQFIMSWLHRRHKIVSVSRAAMPREAYTPLTPPVYEMTDFQREITATLYAIEPYIRASHDRVLIHDWQRLLSSDIIERLDPHTPTHIHASHYDEFISLHNIIRDMLWRAYHPNKKEATRG